MVGELTYEQREARLIACFGQDDWEFWTEELWPDERRRFIDRAEQLLQFQVWLVREAGIGLVDALAGQKRKR